MAQDHSGLTGIEAVQFSTTDLVEAARFLDDWGLVDAGSDDTVLRRVTRDGAEVEVRHCDDPALAPGVEEGASLRAVTWGLADEAALAALAARLGEDAALDAEGLLGIKDPTGFTHRFRVRRRGEAVADLQLVNGPGRANRVDGRSTVYTKPAPIGIGHVVLFIEDLDATLDFFTRRLGFVVSDSYPGHAAFLRCRTPGPHHDAFVLRRPGKPGVNHVAFTVGNIHEVFGSGLAMSAKGWTTDIGPGRHPISSAYFWYFRSPMGGSWEFYADDDYCTADWVPGEFERKPELFAEWAIAGGIDGNTRRQARGA